LIDHAIPEALIQYNEIVQKGFDGQQFISGLAAHFRDLYLSKDQKTVGLLEIGERLQQQYADQSKKLGLPWLAEAIELANNCELNYKNSQNKRLHVELCLIQVASLHFNGEKKKEV
jgi:DNA polymerase-3 subunit gamma/tau